MRSIGVAILGLALSLAGAAQAGQDAELLPRPWRPADPRNFGVDWEKIAPPGPDRLLEVKLMAFIDQWWNLPERLEQAFFWGGAIGAAAAIVIVGLVVVIIIQARRDK